MAANKSEQVIVKNVNVKLESRISNVEKLQAKSEQYNRTNNVKTSRISNEIPDEDLKKQCKNSNIIINPADIGGCHRLPRGRNSTTDNKSLIVKFVNRKHSELMLRSKKSISSKSKVYINHSLCTYYHYVWGK